MENKTVFNLADYDTVAGSEEGARCNLLDPVTGEEIIIDGENLWIEMYGPDSDVYTKHFHAINNNRIKLGKRGKTLESEAIQNESKTLVARVIKDWSPKFVNGNEPFPYSQQNAVKLMFSFPWIYQQLNDFLENRGNFLKK